MDTTTFEPDSSMDLTELVRRSEPSSLRTVVTVEDLLKALGCRERQKRRSRTRALGRAWAIRFATGRRPGACRRALRWFG